MGKAVASKKQFNSTRDYTLYLSSTVSVQIDAPTSNDAGR
jgi:hypothetical protein